MENWIESLKDTVGEIFQKVEQKDQDLEIRSDKSEDQYRSSNSKYQEF